MPTVTVRAEALRRLRGRYPYGHAGDLENLPEVENGELVEVRGPAGEWVGQGYLHPGGTPPLRMLTTEKGPVNAAFYRERVRAAVARRAGVIGTDGLRLVYAEADGLPGVVADRFGDVLAVQLRAAGAERHRDLIVDALRRETGARAAYERSDTQGRAQEGLGAQVRVLWGELPQRVEFFEDDLKLFFDPLKGQKTGFFLDQRDNRRLMRGLAGADFLDVYSYTGTFGLHAARAGARAVALDKDPLALATLEGVARANGLNVGVRLGDALQSLAALRAEGRRFDAAVFDPPTLAKRKADVGRAKGLFADGMEHVLAMLRPGGHALVSTCAHYLRPEDLLDACRVAAAAADCDAELVTVTHQPADHPVLLSVPESLYLKSLLLRKR